MQSLGSYYPSGDFKMLMPVLTQMIEAESLGIGVLVLVVFNELFRGVY